MPAASSHLRGIVLVTAGTLCLVPDASLIRLADADEWVIVFWRSLFVAAALCTVTAVRHRGSTSQAIAGVGRVGIAVGVLWGMTLVMFVYAITHTTVANTLVVVSTAPLFAAVFSRITLGEAVRARTWVATITAIGGVTLAVSESFGGGGLDGDLAAFGVAVALGGNLTVLRHRRETDMLPAIALAGLLAAVAAVVPAWPVGISLHDTAIIGAMGFVLVPAALTFITLGTRDLPAPEVSLLMLLETVLAPLLAWPVVGERPPARAVIGGAVVIATLLAHSLAALSERTSPADERVRSRAGGVTGD